MKPSFRLAAALACVLLAFSTQSRAAQIQVSTRNGDTNVFSAATVGTTSPDFRTVTLVPGNNLIFLDKQSDGCTITLQDIFSSSDLPKFVAGRNETEADKILIWNTEECAFTRYYLRQDRNGNIVGWVPS